VAFLHAFVQRFPAYQGRPFWISGESYGAHIFHWAQLPTPDSVKTSAPTC
jgi:Serine carboxypeptidase